MAIKMSVKKDQLRQSMQNLSQKTSEQPTAFKPIKPLDLDEQANAQNKAVVATQQGTITVTPPRKNIKAKLPKRKWGTVNTSRYSFEITDELKEKLNKRVAEIQLSTGKKVSASEIIRQALARELREL